MAGAPIAADTIRDWLSDARRLPDAGLTVWDGVIAGAPVRLRCTDVATAAAYRSRLTTGVISERAPPGLCFDIIETERVGWPPPGAADIWRLSPDWLEQHLVEQRLAALMPERRTAEAGYPWVFFDPATAHGVVMVRTVGDLPPWTEGAPFSLLFHLAFAWRGWRLLHAATLGLDGRGVLLAGAGGTGKSATTLAGLQAGLETVGDDYIVLQPAPTPTAWPIYRVVKQSPAGLARFPTLDAALSGRPVNWQGKVEFDPEQVFPGCLARSLGLQAIILPVVTGGPVSRFVPTSPARAFSALAASLFSQLPGARLAGFSMLTRLTRALPAFEVQLSGDAAEIGSAMRRFLTRGPV